MQKLGGLGDKHTELGASDTHRLLIEPEIGVQPLGFSKPQGVIMIFPLKDLLVNS